MKRLNVVGINGKSLYLYIEFKLFRLSFYYCIYYSKSCLIYFWNTSVQSWKSTRVYFYIPFYFNLDYDWIFSVFIIFIRHSQKNAELVLTRTRTFSKLLSLQNWMSARLQQPNHRWKETVSENPIFSLLKRVSSHDFNRNARNHVQNNVVFASSNWGLSSSFSSRPFVKVVEKKTYHYKDGSQDEENGMKAPNYRFKMSIHSKPSDKYQEPYSWAQWKS